MVSSIEVYITKRSSCDIYTDCKDYIAVLKCKFYSLTQISCHISIFECRADAKATYNVTNKNS